MSRFHFSSWIIGALGVIPDASTITMSQLCHSAVYSGGIEGLMIENVVEWITAWCVFYTPMKAICNKTIKNEISKLSVAGILRKHKGNKRYYMASSFPANEAEPIDDSDDDTDMPLSPTHDIASTQGTDGADHPDENTASSENNVNPSPLLPLSVENVDLVLAATSQNRKESDKMSTSTTSSGRLRTALDELSQGLSSLIIGDNGEGAAIVRTLANLKDNTNPDNHANLLKELISAISKYTEHLSHYGFTACPEPDLFKWKEKHGLTNRGDEIWTIRDIFSKENKENAWIVSENNHSDYPPPKDRSEYYMKTHENTELLLTGTAEIIAVKHNGEKSHQDYTYSQPGKETLYNIKVRTIFETFRNSEGTMSRLHAGCTIGVTRDQYIDIQRNLLEKTVSSGIPNIVVQNEHTSFGHQIRPSVHLLGFRLAIDREIDTFLRRFELLSRLKNKNYAYVLRDIMNGEVDQNMVVRCHPALKERNHLLLLQCDNSKAFLKGPSDLKHCFFSIYDLFYEAGPITFLSPIYFQLENGKVMEKHHNAILYTKT
jgi:hypothetical protein